MPAVWYAQSWMELVTSWMSSLDQMENGLRHNAPDNLANADRVDTRVLIKGNETTGCAWAQITGSVHNRLASLARE